MGFVPTLATRAQILVGLQEMRLPTSMRGAVRELETRNLDFVRFILDALVRVCRQCRYDIGGRTNVGGRYLRPLARRGCVAGCAPVASQAQAPREVAEAPAMPTLLPTTQASMGLKGSKFAQAPAASWSQRKALLRDASRIARGARQERRRHNQTVEVRLMTLARALSSNSV